jgi:hypothetical protein
VLKAKSDVCRAEFGLAFEKTARVRQEILEILRHILAAESDEPYWSQRATAQIGEIIELDEDLGVAEGQEVEITIRSIRNPRPGGEGLRRCAGALASDWTEEDDRILEAIHADKKRDTRGEIPE